MPKNLFYFNSGAIGEFLMTLFFMENIHLNNPMINLYIIVLRNKNLLQELSARYNYINIIEVNKKNFICKLISFLKFYFDINYFITQPTSGKIPLAVKMIGRSLALRRRSILIGFDDGAKINKYLYTKIIRFNSSIPFFETMKELVRILGFRPEKSLPDYRYDVSKKILRKYDLEENKYIVLHPFAFNPRRSLPSERWRDIINYLASEYENLKIIISGSNQDRELAEEMIRKSQNKNRLLNLSGVLSMNELSNLIDAAELFIGVDTGITHLAGILQKRSVIIGNYSNPYWLPVYNKNAVILYNTENCSCAPCNKKYCLKECSTSYLRCMTDISQDTIKKKLREILA